MCHYDCGHIVTIMMMMVTSVYFWSSRTESPITLRNVSLESRVTPACTATLDETALESITLLNSKVLHQTKIHCIAPVRNVGLESRAAMHLNQLYLRLAYIWKSVEECKC